MRVEAALLLFVLLNFAMVSDLMTGKIYNRMIFAGFIACVCCRFVYAPLVLKSPLADEISVMAGNMITAFLLAFPVFAVGAAGAGDIKLIILAAGFMNSGMTEKFLLLCLIFSGVSAMIYVIRNREIKKCSPGLVHLAPAIAFAGMVCMLGSMT